MIKKTLIVILISLFLLSTPLLAQTVKIGGYTYVPLWSVCRENGIEFYWDSFGRIAILKKNGVEAKLRVGSDKILVKDTVKDIGPPVRFYSGAVVIPRSFSRKNLPYIFSLPHFESRKASHIAKTPAARRIKTIVIDPGHGGKDPGAVGRYGLKEKDVVLDISKRLKKILSGNGIKVILTRTRDIFIPLWKRADIANRKKADFFISMHANAFRKRRVRGFEAYFLSEATDDIARAQEAAENRAIRFEKSSLDRYNPDANTIACDLVLYEQKKVSSQLAEYICKSARKKLYIRNRGVKSARFHVLKNTDMPAVLVEVGFISNKKEEKLLKSPSYRQKVAEAVARGILSYKSEYERTNGFSR